MHAGGTFACLFVRSVARERVLFICGRAGNTRRERDRERSMTARRASERAHVYIYIRGGERTCKIFGVAPPTLLCFPSARISAPSRAFASLAPALHLHIYIYSRCVHRHTPIPICIELISAYSNRARNLAEPIRLLHIYIATHATVSERDYADIPSAD